MILLDLCIFFLKLSFVEKFLLVLLVKYELDFCDYADDSMAILMAFHCPEVEVIGLTTVFGNAQTEDATRNALLLVRDFFPSRLGNHVNHLYVLAQLTNADMVRLDIRGVSVW